MDKSKQPHSQHRTDNNNTLDMNTQSNILGLTLDPKLTYNKHIDNTTSKASKTLPIQNTLVKLHSHPLIDQVGQT